MKKQTDKNRDREKQRPTDRQTDRERGGSTDRKRVKRKHGEKIGDTLQTDLRRHVQVFKQTNN